MPKALFVNLEHMRKLKEIYIKILPVLNNSLSFLSQVFANNIGCRIYTEWLRHAAREIDNPALHYQGEAFEKFISDEAHYEGRREYLRGFQNVWSEEGHKRREDLVLRALAVHAFDYFSKDGWKTGNIRCSLEPWINAIKEQDYKVYTANSNRITK